MPWHTTKKSTHNHVFARKTILCVIRKNTPGKHIHIDAGKSSNGKAVQFAYYVANRMCVYECVCASECVCMCVCACVCEIETRRTIIHNACFFRPRCAHRTFACTHTCARTHTHTHSHTHTHIFTTRPRTRFQKYAWSVQWNGTQQLPWLSFQQLTWYLWYDTLFQ